MAAPLTLSVIIPTYNGAHKVKNLLHRLELQTQLPDEVIVVVDGSTDGTEAILAAEHFTLPAFRVISRENGGRAKVRNTGAANAAKDLLLFMDDDMLPEPGCIQAHVHHHQQHPGSILTGPATDYNDPKLSDVRKFKSWLSAKWSEPLIAGQGQPLDPDAAFLTAANCSMPVSVFRQLNGFDERLRDVEDYDLALRAVSKGIPLYYDHRAFAWHNDPLTCRSYIRRQQEYAGALKQVRQLQAGNSHTSQATSLSSLKRFFFRLFRSDFWVASIDRNIWPYLLPKRLRYRLYDWVITAHSLDIAANN